MQTLHASPLNGVVPVQYPIIQSVARNQWIDVNNESSVTLSVGLGGRMYLIPPNTTARYAMDNTETFVTFTPQSAADPTKDTVSGTIYNEQDSIPVEVERGANASDILPITSAMIADGAVTAAKVATAAINTNNIVNGAITNPLLGALAVANSNIQAGAVANAQLADGSVGTTKIANLAVTNALIANAAVGTAQIANAAITTALIANLAVTDALIANVSASKISAGTISASISITAPTINGGTITGSTIQTAASGARWVLSGNTFGQQSLAGYPNVGEITPSEFRVEGSNGVYAETSIISAFMDNTPATNYPQLSLINYVASQRLNSRAILTDGFGQLQIQGGVITMTPPIWHSIGASGEPGFNGNWSNYFNGFYGLAFSRQADGTVHLRGAVRNTVDGSQPLFTLPLGYRPQATVSFIVPAFGGTQRYEISTAGVVQWRENYGSPSDAYLIFDGANFTTSV